MEAVRTDARGAAQEDDITVVRSGGPAEPEADCHGLVIMVV